MKTKVIPIVVKPEVVKKLRADVDHAEQDAATDKLLAGLKLGDVETKLQKEITALKDRVSLLEQ
ncbi:hypothetical protein LCGC14_2618790 [marine sediment metagenome]|uniref:Uncharacterized protein n=1 Tax=marine sediment metagenome TaxID=412755 RepID=A0A0F9CEP1_9ZZZZ